MAEPLLVTVQKSWSTADNTSWWHRQSFLYATYEVEQEATETRRQKPARQQDTHLLSSEICVELRRVVLRDNVPMYRG